MWENLFKGSDWDYFFKVAQDDELRKIVMYLKRDLDIARKNLIDIIQKIIKYLNQIRQQSIIYKKLQKIKQLKDQLLLKEKSNFVEVVRNETALFFQNEFKFSTKPSLSFFQSDEAYNTLIKVSRKKLKKRMITPVEIASAISDEFLTKSEKRRQGINLGRLKQIFLSRGGNLFEFIINYKFDDNIDTNERITLFCQMASLYGDELNILDQYNLYKNIQYVIIEPR